MEKEERPQRVRERNPLFFFPRGRCVSNALVESSRARDVIGAGQAAQSGRIILLLSVAVVPRVLCQVRNCHKLPAARRTHAGGPGGGGGGGAMKFPEKCRDRKRLDAVTRRALTLKGMQRGFLIFCASLKSVKAGKKDNNEEGFLFFFSLNI